MTRDTYDRLEDRCSMVTASIDHGHTEGRRLENVWRPHGHTTLLRVMQASRAGDVCLTDIEAAHRGVMESLEQNEECKAAYGAVGSWLVSLAHDLEELYEQEGGEKEALFPQEERRDGQPE